MQIDRDYLAGLLSLEGEVALITGARHGIGAAAAVAMAKAGARVALTAHEIHNLDHVVRDVEAAGSEALALELEVRDPARCERAVEETVARFGRLDILVNNAGVVRSIPALDLPEAEWDAVLDTNLKGAFFMAQAAAKRMRESGGGRIVNLSSTIASAAQPNAVAYGSSKAGLEHMTRILAREWAPFAITVNGVAPTSTLTDTRLKFLATEEARQRRAVEIPLGRIGTTDDVVPAILFLAGPAGAFVTGHTLYADGGFTLGRFGSPPAAARQGSGNA